MHGLKFIPAYRQAGAFGGAPLSKSGIPETVPPAGGVSSPPKAGRESHSLRNYKYAVAFLGQLEPNLPLQTRESVIFFELRHKSTRICQVFSKLSPLQSFL